MSAKGAAVSRPRIKGDSDVNTHRRAAVPIADTMFEYQKNDRAEIRRMMEGGRDTFENCYRRIMPLGRVAP